MKKTIRSVAAIVLWNAIGLALSVAATAPATPPVEALTTGPEFHWFGYYDKLQFDPSGRYVLCMETDFEHRSPTKDDVIKVGMVDRKDGNRWIELGESRAWGWQQGCMLQWIPGSGSKVIWNDRCGDKFVSIVKDIKTGEEKTLSKAVYALSPDGKHAVGTDFARIQNYRKGYGYPGGTDPYKHQNTPENAGIYKIDLETGESSLLLSYRQIAEIPNAGVDISDKWHYFNHLLVSPDGQRFIFLNRWRDAPISDEVLANAAEYNKTANKFTTRMFTAGMDGEDVYLLDPSGKTSHFIWKDPEHITAWTHPGGRQKGFWEFKDKTAELRQVGKGIMVKNGHNTYLPKTGQKWILNDTYPQGKNREQIPYLFQESTGTKIELGRFHEPKEYKGEWRCDTHPRASNDGKLVCIDSTHGGNGRQLYLIDISGIIQR
ncbi:MAG: hypothetical protein K9M45_05235 [Kiritimatiellales bacterium]|nr:hypothetical protein [Kiritimatiellales bacterium]